MQNKSLQFPHPVAFWLGCMAIIGGVLAHLPMFMCAANMGYRMAGMEMDATMLFGMALIPVGFALSAYGLLPRMHQARLQQGTNLAVHFSENAGLNFEHWKLVTVLFVALAVDVLKPATLGFVLPGMSAEYGISKQTAGWLPLVALTGTTVGSILWGRIADAFGRRAAILLSALMFIGTAICGAMPSFNWNLAMCFLMGASAGGLLPITFTLMAEMIPTAHRGWLLVALGGFGTSAGYLLAAESAALLEPLFSWRSLWLLGLPTGALILFLNRFIPESPRFLMNAGLMDQARSVLQRFSGTVTLDTPTTQIAAQTAPAKQSHGPMELIRGPHATITLGLTVCGVAWGLLNFGFLLWLPSNLRNLDMDAGASSRLLAHSAMLALPGILLVIWLYHSWSSIKTLILFIVLSTASLLVFYVLGTMGIHSTASITIATASLLISSSGVIAMLIPYAAEIYPVYLRATGSGLIAAASKFGGILGAACGVLGLFNNMTFSALFIAIPMGISAILLGRSGIDTRGQNLEEIQQSISDAGLRV